MRGPPRNESPSQPVAWVAPRRSDAGLPIRTVSVLRRHLEPARRPGLRQLPQRPAAAFARLRPAGLPAPGAGAAASGAGAVRRAQLSSPGIPADAPVPGSAEWLSGTAGSARLAVSDVRPAGVRSGAGISPAARGLRAGSSLSDLRRRRAGLWVDSAAALRPDLHGPHGAAAYRGALPASACHAILGVVGLMVLLLGVTPA